MMSKFFGTVIFIVIMLPGIPLYADANVLTNPGFESGTVDWQARGGSISTVTSPVNSGTSSARSYDRTATWQGIQQDMLGKMVEGATYQVSGYVRTSTSASSDVKITFQQTDGAGINYLWAASGTASNSGWTYISGNFTLNVTGTLTELLVYVEGPESGIDIFVDDMEVYGPEPGPIIVTSQIDVNTRHQMIEGFGAAGAWYEGSLVNHPNKNTLYSLLFGELGLDIYRVRNAYDQSGGADYMSKSGQIVAAGQATLSHPLKILISSWSPPDYLKSNGTTANGGTLKKDGTGNYMYTEFAQWWADSITAWSSYGVDADYISIQNEPDWSASWDTCLFNGTETATLAGYNLAFEAVWQEMNTRMGAAMPKMLAGESAGIPGSYQYLNNLIDLNHVYGHAHHLYNLNSGDNPDGYLTAMTDFAAQFGNKPLIQTEYEKATDLWPDALNMAHLLHNALTVEEVAAYLYWDLFWGGGGLISLTSTDYTINNDYYGFKHFSAFIHDGWQRVDVSNGTSSLKISAYLSPNDQELSVVIVNTGTSQAQVDLSFAGFTISSGDVYRTSQAENCAFIGSYDPANPLAVPAESVTTLSLEDMSPPAAPTGLTATNGNAIVTLDWNDNSEPDLDGYNVWRSTASGSGYTQINGSLVTGSDYIDTGVTTGVTYFYVVTALDTLSNESGNSNEDFATPYDAVPPQSPTGLAALSGNETVSLQWNDNIEGDLAGYNIYRSTTSGTGYTKLNGSLLPTSDYTDNTAANYTSYFYVITAVDTDSYESDNSNQVSATPHNGTIALLSMEDFELGLGDWNNISGEDTHDWTLNSGGTSTNNTGPDGGADSSTWYVYLECSNGGASTAGDTAILEGPDLGGMARELTFSYHMFGNEMGTLSVDVFDGTWQLGVWSLSGPQQASSSDPYQTVTVDLAEYTGPVRIRFRGEAAGGFRGDMAIDNIEVTGVTVYGDFDFDNRVDVGDLSEFMSHWLEADCVNLDLNGDCLITLYEFAEVAKYWLDASYQ